MNARETGPAAGPAAGPVPEPAPEPEEEREVSLEDERSADDRDEGWGERSGSGFDDDWYLSQRPPHWD
ncbi:hypothetical protein [Kineococcus rhizosphaerae]|uniref:Uncharacterized protein n=1 Tax=Kineococcus rhizosphaerae TaxID=559628 RepID=A0A2T0R0Z7_9ACTN|nr:hypothetical protein [Kineococcus rhizosphaerae]PRY12973.1 hypothetical protein CLV37_109160 [Kineococcus rhizosphaerae]